MKDRLDYQTLTDMWVQGNREGVIETLEYDNPEPWELVSRVITLIFEMQLVGIDVKPLKAMIYEKA